MGPFLARVDPEEPLLDHLRGVGEGAQRFLEPLGLGEEGLLAGLVHDLGKATPYFQELLRGKRRRGDPLTVHALPGALYGAWVARKRGRKPLPLFLAVLGHHGGLRTPWEAVPHHPKRGKGAWRVLGELLKALDTPAFRALVEDLGLPDPGPFFQEAWKEAKRLADEADGLLERREGLDLHYRTALLLSALADADRTLAGGWGPGERRPLSPALAEALRWGKPPSPLAPFREALYRGVEEALGRPLEDLFPARLTLSAPTGAGKTLAALRFALGLRERAERERGVSPRILYVLPYLAIADQVEGEIRRGLKALGLDPSLLLVHHHLALARLREEEPLEEALLLQETWDAEMVLTTFPAFFRALVGPSAGGLRPLHRLAGGSVILLDEVQTLPVRFWPLLRALLAELPGANTVVSMTATQPGLVRGEEIAPPLPGYPQRTAFRLGPWRTLEGLADALAEGAERDPKARLVVLNTVREAVALYRLLQERGVPHLYHLTSHLTPKDRAKRLEAIRGGLARGEPVLLVATQVVEAGVDLDFQEGYRALGPLESLLQAAGRVNRNGRQEEATLWVLDLEGASWKRIYGEVLVDRTRRILGEDLERGIPDLEAYRRLSAYYREVEEGLSQERGQEALKRLARLDYDGLDFNLLEEAPSLPIFVEQDEEATRLLEALEEALALKDPKERRKGLRLLRPRLSAYTVSPLLQRAVKNLPPPLLGREDYRHVPREGLEDYYDGEVGFKWELEQFL
ncbi:CRISPR-associated endonuclease Cas3'' [Thermus sp.]|uniref:CRISPR-associated endonuclease Cas3'' n=1 Tax=Thermus sp. TaxID=275 RepID=UPI00307E532F